VALEKIQNKTAPVYITEMFCKLFNEVAQNVQFKWNNVENSEFV
jgi:hypothetical protein